MPYPWLKIRSKTSPPPRCEAPIPLGDRSNGEYFHTQTPRERRILSLIEARADAMAPRFGLDRREFLATSMGMATSLWAINVAGCGGDPGGGGGSGGTGSTGDGSISTGSGSVTTNGFEVSSDGLSSSGTAVGTDESGSTGEPGCDNPLDPSREFIFDVQTHHVNPQGAWRETNPGWVDFFEGLPQGACGLEAVECFSVDHYIEQMYLNSDTTIAVLSGVPALLCSRDVTSGCGNPLPNEEMIATRELINMLAHSQRSVNHAMITPNVDLQLQLDMMQQLVEEMGVAGWKCYPPWGPNTMGWWLDDPAIGIPFIERGRKLGVRTFCIHKGLPLYGFDEVHTNPRDVGVVAAAYPDCNFVVYHSAWLHGGFGVGEGPYDPMGRIDPMNPVLYPVDQGVNSLISSMQAEGLGPGSNVYAELGSVWTNLMAYPDQAAHVIGKLLLHVGEDNVLWGTDCIWTGSPQPLIEAFRAFQISEPFQETYGYPALTDAIKRKIFGLNAAAVFGVDPDAVRCEIDASGLGRAKRFLDAELGPRRFIAHPAAGPRSRREFMRFKKLTEGPG